jgi:hypothetical protein
LFSIVLSSSRYMNAGDSFECFGEIFFILHIYSNHVQILIHASYTMPWHDLMVLLLLCRFDFHNMQANACSW